MRVFNQVAQNLISNIYIISLHNQDSVPNVKIFLNLIVIEKTNNQYPEQLLKTLNVKYLKGILKIIMVCCIINLNINVFVCTNPDPTLESKVITLSFPHLRCIYIHYISLCQAQDNVINLLSNVGYKYSPSKPNFSQIFIFNC